VTSQQPTSKSPYPRQYPPVNGKYFVESGFHLANLQAPGRIDGWGSRRGILFSTMSHTLNDKEKLIWRVRRIRGQVEAVERALNGEQDCSDVLQLITAARGAMNSLIVEVLEGHIREHVLDPKQKPDSQHVAAAEELIDVLRSYLK